MGIKMSNVKGATQSTTVKWEDEEASLTYRPSAVTPALMDEVLSAEATGKGHHALTGLLTQVLVAWEVLDDEGTPLSITTETLSTMPLSFLTAIANAIQEDMGAGEAQRPSGSG